MNEKTVKTSGADERTPSRSEYFSWINNTNEGSTEKQTLVNLAFFRYLKERYRMSLDIYAWDAGNLDGAGNSYETLDGEKLSKQYPHGYAPVVEAAADMGTRLGVWGGADGYGEDERDAEKRRQLLVKLCKDYRFALFKFDAVCGLLREDKREEFAKSLRECRRYSPDLILLNHRNDLGNAEIYATTFLWKGMETYVDVHGYNPVTAPHNRAYMFFRGHTPELKRLTEDHGVCISSSIDYFEDDLVYQAFNRSLILAPEIYGNPWLMRDDELPLLARVYNLHRRFREILVDGMLPDEDMGDNAAIRGDKKRRFLATGNAAWTEKKIRVPLNGSIGLAPCERVCVTRHFPTEKFLGCFSYGESVEISLPPFRATLVEFCDADVADKQIIGCEYLVLHEREDGSPDEINVLYSDGAPSLFDPAKNVFSPLSTLSSAPFDARERAPEKICSLQPCPVPSNAEQLYETACFGADNDPLELRSLRRSGKTEIPEVQAARDEFFHQESYRLRGLDTNIPFDGDPDTFFDTKSRAYYNFEGRKGFRVEGGCLRVDFGCETTADRIEFEYFDAGFRCPSMFEEQIPAEAGEVSSDLLDWRRAPLVRTETMREATIPYFAYYVDKREETKGLRKKAVYALSPAPAKKEGEPPAATFRYFRLPCPMDRIYSVRFFEGEKELVPVRPKLTNLFAAYEKKRPKAAATARFQLGKLPLHPYLAAAFEGKTGSENAYCCAEIDGKLYAFPARAPAYPSNVYEYPEHPVDGFYTFFLPLRPEWADREIAVYALFADNSVPVDVYLCDGHGKREGLLAKLPS